MKRKIKNGRYTEYLIEGKYFTLKQLTIKLNMNYGRIRDKVLDGSTTFEDIKSAKKIKRHPNFRESMYADRHGHWKLLSKVLKC